MKNIENIKIGDIVKLDGDVEIGHIIANDWFGCKEDTIRFLHSYSGVDTQLLNNGVVINGINSYSVEFVREGENYILPFGMVRPYKRQQIKELTVKEIEKELGYSIKIVMEK